ncbi:hypothetical protein X737_38605 [Mesorhizobium sp. L48C026A00]|nr:hypothetical protein X737_38605 [Mesorhizobium sp. L48C026A00]
MVEDGHAETVDQLAQGAHVLRAAQGAILLRAVFIFGEVVKTFERR